MENSIEEDIERLKLCSTNQCNICGRYEKEECMLERNRCEQHILSAYQEVLKENEILKKEKEQAWEEWNNLEQGSYETEQKLKQQMKELQKENEQLRTEVNSLKEDNERYQETYKDVREELKELKKENKELLQEKINNQKIIALAQNEALGYMQAYEDGKKLKRSAVANIVENQQYYIIKKQIEKYKTDIEQLRKELGQKDKIIDLMANHIATSDSDLCEYLDITTKCKYYAGDNGKTCDNCIKQYFENEAKEIR